MAAPKFVELAYLEADHGYAVSRLEELLSAREPGVAARAARALGRVGDAAAVSALLAALADASGDLEVAIVMALGLAGDARAEPSLVERSMGGELQRRVAAVTALGRVGKDTAQVALGRAMTDEAALIEAAAIAFGKLGKRSIALTAEAEQALLAALGKPAARQAEVRYAIIYALAQEHEPKGRGAAVKALARAATDDDAMVRMVAVQGLGRRGAAEPEVLLNALSDTDWRVRVEAVRALAAGGGSEAHTAVAVSLARAWAESNGGVDSGSVHVANVAAEVLAAITPSPAVVATIEKFVAVLARSNPGAALASSTLHCKVELLRALASNQRASLAECGGGSKGVIAAERRRAFMQQAVARGPANLKSVLTVVGHGIKDTAAVVRVAALEAVTARLQDKAMAGDMAPLLLGALGDAAPAVVGTALDGLASESFPKELRAEAAGRVIELLSDGALDLEVRMSGLAALGALQQPAASATCRLDHVHRNRSVRAAARACLLALANQDPGPGEAREQGVPPKLSPAPLLGKRVRWMLTTSRGEIVIELWPDLAPWAVASVVELSRRQFYDGTVFHRVVPGFVVQGGDPTATGWGGPGYVLPAEPSTEAFAVGAVGIADAGPGTGGSQFFIMHARAPHLEGRYTVVGKVERGFEVAMSLVVGDRIVSAQVEVTAIEPVANR